MPMPFVTVMLALKVELADALLETPIAGSKPVLVRHHRHREANEDEWPCVSIRYVSNDPSQLGREETGGGMPEQVMELALNLVIDAPLPAEATSADDEDLDPTGYGVLSDILAVCINRLFPELETNTLGETTWMIRYDGNAAEEGSASPDQARLEERLTLFYRVRADQPTILLTGS